MVVAVDGRRPTSMAESCMEKHIHFLVCHPAESCVPKSNLKSYLKHKPGCFLPFPVICNIHLCIVGNWLLQSNNKYYL